MGVQNCGGLWLLAVWHVGLLRVTSPIEIVSSDPDSPRFLRQIPGGIQSDKTGPEDLCHATRRLAMGMPSHWDAKCLFIGWGGFSPRIQELRHVSFHSRQKSPTNSSFSPGLDSEPSLS